MDLEQFYRLASVRMALKHPEKTPKGNWMCIGCLEKAANNLNMEIASEAFEGLKKQGFIVGNYDE